MTHIYHQIKENLQELVRNSRVQHLEQLVVRDPLCKERHQIKLELLLKIISRRFKKNIN